MITDDRNTLWARAFVDELVRSGLRTVSVAPGSRSTPLTLAFAGQKKIDLYMHDDERSAGFFALGMALVCNEPTALLCTSGTAAANFYPAIIEAFYAKVPLLVLTADRPHEQRDSGANQTIDQVKMYKDHALWSVEVAPPEADPPARTLRHLRALACRALAIATGFPNGPVHLNFPFRKPLEPTPSESDVSHVARENFLGFRGRTDEAPFTRMSRGQLTPAAGQIECLVETIQSNARGLIVCGPQCAGNAFPEAVVQLSKVSGYPILADALSGVRFGAHIDEHNDGILGGYETFLQNVAWEPPQLILRFGAMPTSKFLGDYLASLEETKQVAISENGSWADPTQRLSDFLWVDPEILCRQVAARLEGDPAQFDGRWVAQIQSAERRCWSALDESLQREFLEETILIDVVNLMPEGANLFVSNSLPVRHLDQFAKPCAARLNLFGNRGASGIDGIVSSALGVAAASGKPLALVTGDLAFYHDINGLMAIKRYGIKATIVVLNNDGGGIFRRLPIAQSEPTFEALFITPHGLNFEPVATLFGLGYTQVNTRQAFGQAFTTALAANHSQLIEIPFDGQHNHRRHQQIVAEVLEKIKVEIVQGLGPEFCQS